MIVASACFVNLFNELNVLSEEFHLTGSRFFTGNGNDTDFFVSYSPEVRRKLVDLGFKAISNDRYGDSNCVMVMRGYNHDSHQIDIQLVKDVNLKLCIQTAFKKAAYVSPTKEEWNAAFAVVKNLD